MTQTQSDFGTPELQARGITFTGDTNSEKVAHVITQVPLDHYINRGLISIEQFEAGEEYHRLWYYGAEKSKFSQMRFSVELCGSPNYETSIMMEELYRNAERSIRGVVQKLVAFNVCCMGEWAGYLNYVGKNRRMEMLKEGLEDLHKHFKGNRK